ncbi:uncharacterized protein VTP21DRAFT_7583 [Calcarisporiella thermophila]|uniref:uncharacterized protein n=1 Tax=Calcarisporiella thermophila TaxID=911321 RepID=UPI0037447664
MSALLIKTLALFLVLAITAFAQEDHHHMAMPENLDTSLPPSYMTYKESRGLLVSHIVFMVLGYGILLPMGMALGISRSRWHIPCQVFGIAAIIMGYFFGHSYGHSTPDFYPNNLHHKFGKWLLALTFGQIFLGVARKIAKRKEAKVKGSDYTSVPSSETEAIRLVHNGGDGDDELLLESPVSMSGARSWFAHLPMPARARYHQWTARIPRVVSVPLGYATYMLSALLSRAFTSTVLFWSHRILGRLILILAFMQVILGAVAFTGGCQAWEVLGCIAHYIKGAIFFWYGILTFARFLGCFAEWGWAWNVVPDHEKYITAEFIEAFTVFLYGITNTWMEHFGQSSEWSHKDFQHASLAFMWWWAGLCGVLLELRWVRRRLDRVVGHLDTSDSQSQPSSLQQQQQHPQSHQRTSEEVSDDAGSCSSSTTAVFPGDARSRPNTLKPQRYGFNPFVALIILVTGISMGNHHQLTAFSTQIHWLWGLYLALFAVFRLITQLLLYIRPPTTVKPSRPPSEALAAFCLTAGGVLFMMSNQDMVDLLMKLGVDPMFLINVVTAITFIVLIWTCVLIVISYSGPRFNPASSTTSTKSDARKDSGYDHA